MAKFARAQGVLFNLYKQISAPTALQSVAIGDIWVDTDAVPLSVNVCTSISPITFSAVSSSTIAESDVTFTDVTTNNSSTSKHGYLKKLSNVSTEFMNGQGDWAAPSVTPTSQVLSIGAVGSVNNSASGSGTPINQTPTYTLAGNTLTTGMCLRVTAGFLLTTGSAPSGISFRLLSGSTDICAPLGGITPPANRTGWMCNLVYYLQAAATPGASVGVYTSVVTSQSTVNGNSAYNTIAQPINLATNANMDLKISTMWDSAGTGTNTVQLINFVVEKLG
jgi:hypothetical protein